VDAARRMLAMSPNVIRWSLVAALCGGIAACVFTPPAYQARNPRVILDVYYIAHSMAETYGYQPHADPKVAAELARLDARARDAIASLATSRFGDTSDTVRAVSALADYAAAQSSVEPPPVR